MFFSSQIQVLYLHTITGIELGELMGLLFSQRTAVKQENTRTLEVYEIQCWTLKFKLYKKGSGDLLGSRAGKRY